MHGKNAKTLAMTLDGNARDEIMPEMQWLRVSRILPQLHMIICHVAGLCRHRGPSLSGLTHTIPTANRWNEMIHD